jgi:hypothetical protein
MAGVSVPCANFFQSVSIARYGLVIRITQDAKCSKSRYSFLRTLRSFDFPQDMPLRLNRLIRIRSFFNSPPSAGEKKLLFVIFVSFVVNDFFISCLALPDSERGWAFRRRKRVCRRRPPRNIPRSFRASRSLNAAYK